MSPVQQNPTDAAHRNLQNILLNGRILINGMPLTANELSGVLQGEQMLFEKAAKFDAASALAEVQKKNPKEPKKKPNIVPIREPEKK